jgi:hypothetical protein
MELTITAPVGSRSVQDEFEQVAKHIQLGYEHQRSLLPPADMETPGIREIESNPVWSDDLTKCVKNQVIPMIFPKDLNLARSLAYRVTIQEQHKFDSCREFDEKMSFVITSARIYQAPPPLR